MNIKAYLYVILAAVCTYLSLFHFNFYFFGRYDQTITIAFVKNLMNPDLYSGDILISQKDYLMTYFWELISQFTLDDSRNIPIVFFSVFLSALFFTYYTIVRLSQHLFSSTTVTVLVLLLIMIKHRLIGHATSLDNMLVTRIVALPILIFSIEQFLKKRYLTTFILIGISFLIHALFATFVLAILTLPFLWEYKKLSLKAHGVPFLAFFTIISPLLLKKFTSPLANPFTFFANEEWINLLRIRSAHHAFPSTWSLDIFLSTAGMVLLLFIGLWYLKQLEARLEIKRMGYAFLILFLIGWVFTEIVPVTIVVQFQFFRSSVILFYITSIVAAGALFETIRTSNIKLYLVILGLSYTLFHTLVRVDSSLYYLVFVTITSVLFLAGKFNLPNKVTHSVLIASLVLLFYFNFDHGSIIIDYQQKKPWKEVQHWAKENTAIDAAFIIPPAKEGFRMGSERRIYCNYKEGTYLFFNLDYGQEWFRRMETLGFVPGENLDEPFKKLSADDFEAIKVEMSATGELPTYVVTYPDHELDYPIVFSNPRYTVYQL
jgi:hypothetical protein